MDGNKIVFKRGYWSQTEQDFIYDLAELDLRTGNITMLTADSEEESMPVYAEDGSILYSGITESGTGVFRLDPDTLEKECLFWEENMTAYYPMIRNSQIFFSKWVSQENQNDCIAELTENGARMLSFCEEHYNTSDAFPLDNGAFFYSSTKNGGYDLMYYDGTDEFYLDALSDEGQDLGTCFYSCEEAVRLTGIASKYLLHSASTDIHLDADGNGIVNGFDLAFLKKLTHQ